MFCSRPSQALRVELVPYLLRLLEGIGLETLENPSAIKAQIVKALKSMTRSLQFGEQVRLDTQRPAGSPARRHARVFGEQIRVQMNFFPLTSNNGSFAGERDSSQVVGMERLQRPEARPVHLGVSDGRLPDR